MIEKIIDQRQKERIAYRVNEHQLSYGQLTQKAKHYGELLKRQGTSPVLLYGHKDIDLFVAIFACIHSGRAYIPVDLFTPYQRIQNIVDSTNCQLILSNESITVGNAQTKKLKELECYKSRPVNDIVNDIAYIIFTSGSTGEPKGVPISYSNLFHFIKWISSLKPLNEYKNATVLNQASFSFDLSVADVFYAISNGHTLVALDKEHQQQYQTIFKTLSQNAIQVLVTTPTFLKLCMVNTDFHSANFPAIQCVYSCGEQLEAHTAKKLFERFPDVQLINAYGPTEATSAVSAAIITKEMANGDLLPCGDSRTFATEIRIIEDEIVLKGKSVFSGYLGDIAGGFYKENKLPCFKTGDIGFIKNHYLYCKGRKDSQVKYKGYRIELSDIERNLYKIDGIKQCAVIAKYQNPYTVKGIRAFVVLEQGLTPDLVKEQLKKRIPLYMMPKQIIPMDALPVNSNNKIDRKQLMEL